MTPTQTRIVLEAIQYERQQALYEQALIMKSSVNSAIVAAFGEDKGEFSKWLESLKPGTNGDAESQPIMPAPVTADAIKNRVSNVTGMDDDWEEMP